MDHHMEVNPNAGPIESDHLGNPLILIHGVLMFVSYGLMLPIGIMFGIRRHRYHVPWNTVAVLIALAGYFFGFIHHTYEGDDDHDHDHTEAGLGAGDNGADMVHNDTHMYKRQAGDTSADHYGIKIGVHKTLGIFLFLLLLLQTAIGVYRKLSKTRSRLRVRWMTGPIPRGVHKYLGRAHLPIAYIQILLGAVKLTEAAEGQFFGQAISHLVMGGSFWWYGCLYIAYIINSFPSVRRPEYVESIVMTVWGVINFSILHQWGTRWSHSDLEHTSLGLLWAFGGATSLLIESRFNPLKAVIGNKNPMPALMIMMTGYAMGQHAQYFQFSTTVHTFFGYSLMLSGVCRLIQLALRPTPVVPSVAGWVSGHDGDRLRSSSMGTDDDATIHDGHGKRRFGPGEAPVEGIARSETPTSAFFGFLSGFGIIESGLLFQSAHERQINWAMYYMPDASVYILWFTCIAFASVLYLMLILQAGRKSDSRDSTPPQAYNRLCTNAQTDDPALSTHDIEMSGFLEDERDD
ncbi:hypothetical protein BGW41_004153 [Actinomortierella wolfii]|nr:hypothetical protein BGW41_004153 [Actinomortierella wolfii]